MNLSASSFAALAWVMLIASSGLAQDVKKAAPPVAFPKLEKFEPLWQRSIFTTKDLPAPEVPGGPNFADNLSLFGGYEINGAIVAVLVDRTTSQVTEVRIGSENEMGVKVRKIEGEITDPKVRVQLQKGDKTGWVTINDPSAAQPAEVIQRAVIPTQAGSAVQSQRTMNTSPVNPILPPPSTPVPSTPINDVPLPPP